MIMLPPMQKPSPMTLGNMRANGVRTLAAWRLGRGCDHRVRWLFLYFEPYPVRTGNLK